MEKVKPLISLSSQADYGLATAAAAAMGEIMELTVASRVALEFPPKT